MSWRSGLKKCGMNPRISERMEGKCFEVGAAGSYGELLKNCMRCIVIGATDSTRYLHRCLERQMSWSGLPISL